MSYQPGSQIDLGLKLCQRMDEQHKAEGRQAIWAGTDKLWSATHWAAYHQRLAELNLHNRAAVNGTPYPDAPADWPTQEEIDIIVGGNYGYA